MRKVYFILLGLVLSLSLSLPLNAQVIGEDITVVCKNGESYTGTLVSANNLVVKLLLKGSHDERLIYVDEISTYLNNTANPRKTSEQTEQNTTSEDNYNEVEINKQVGKKVNLFFVNGKSKYSVYILGAKDGFIFFSPQPDYPRINYSAQGQKLRNIRNIEFLDTDPGFTLNFDLSAIESIKGHSFNIQLADGTEYRNVLVLDYSPQFGQLRCSFSKKPIIKFRDIKELTLIY